MTDNPPDVEAPETWDWPAAENQPAVPKPGVTVSVKYSAAEFEAVAECAQRDGQSVTEFIRTVVLEAARGRSTPR